MLRDGNPYLRSSLTSHYAAGGITTRIPDASPPKTPTALRVGGWWDVPANIGKAKDIASGKLAKGSRDHNDEGDAMRHAEWSRRMSEEIGSATSWIAGVGHEIEGVLDGEPWSEAMMYLINNAEGRAAAREKRSVAKNNLQKEPKRGFQFNPYDPSKYWFQQ